MSLRKLVSFITLITCVFSVAFGAHASGASTTLQTPSPEQSKLASAYLDEVALELASDLVVLSEPVFNAFDPKVALNQLVDMLKRVRKSPKINRVGRNPMGMPEPRFLDYGVDPKTGEKYIEALAPYFESYGLLQAREPKWKPMLKDFATQGQAWTIMHPRDYLKRALLHEMLHHFGYREARAYATSLQVMRTHLYLSALETMNDLSAGKAEILNAGLGCGAGTGLYRGGIESEPYPIDLRGLTLEARIADCAGQVGIAATQKFANTTWKLLAWRASSTANAGHLRSRAWWLNSNTGTIWYVTDEPAGQMSFADANSACKSLPLVSGAPDGVYDNPILLARGQSKLPTVSELLDASDRGLFALTLNPLLSDFTRIPNQPAIWASNKGTASSVLLHAEIKQSAPTSDILETACIVD